MQVWRGGPAGGSDKADNVTSLDSLTNSDQRSREVTVACRQAVTVIDHQEIAIRCFSFGKQNDAIRRCVDLGIVQSGNIYAEVKLGIATERIRPISVATCNGPPDRPDIRYIPQPVRPLDSDLFEQR